MLSGTHSRHDGRRHLGIWIAMLSGSVAAACVTVTLAAEPVPPEITPEAIDAARSPEQHEAIAKAYAREAAEAHAAASEHRNMANPPGGYSSLMRPGADARRLMAEPTVFLYHCRKLADNLEQVGREADALAQAHHMMAERAKAAGVEPPAH